MRHVPLALMLALAAASCAREAPPGAAPAPVPAALPSQAATPAAGPSSAVLLTESMGEGTRDGQVQRFGPGNLWEYINGGAEQYLAFGFQELQTAAYTLPVGGRATVDLYRMSDRLRAFGIYAQETNPKREAVALGVEGRAGTSAVEFWAGTWYAKLTVMPAGPDAKPALLALAKAVAGRLGAPGFLPAEVALLPPQGLIPGSVRLVPEDALGQAAFATALEAKYTGTPAPLTLVLVPFASMAAAEAAAGDYAAFLGQAGSPPAVVDGLADGGFSASDRYYGRIVAARSGRWLAISLGEPAGAGRALVARAAARLAGTGTPSAEGSPR